MIYEIRNDYFERTRFEAYKGSTKNQAMAYLKRNLNAFGFWASNDPKPDINGRPTEAPM